MDECKTKSVRLFENIIFHQKIKVREKRNNENNKKEINGNKWVFVKNMFD